jgi:hypothetical protein
MHSNDDELYSKEPCISYKNINCNANCSVLLCVLHRGPGLKISASRICIARRQHITSLLPIVWMLPIWVQSLAVLYTKVSLCLARELLSSGGVFALFRVLYLLSNRTTRGRLVNETAGTIFRPTALFGIRVGVLRRSIAS